MINRLINLINVNMTPLTQANSSVVKREFGKYFDMAVGGHPVLVGNQMTNEKAVLVDYEDYMELLEIMEEMGDEELNSQLEASYKEFKAGKATKGIEDLIDLMNLKKKKKLLAD